MKMFTFLVRPPAELSNEDIIFETVSVREKTAAAARIRLELAGYSVGALWKEED